MCVRRDESGGRVAAADSLSVAVESVERGTTRRSFLARVTLVVGASPVPAGVSQSRRSSRSGRFVDDTWFSRAALDT